MAWTRRKGLEDSAIRAQLIEAAAQLIQAEGCSAVTAGRLAEQLNLTRHIVHYYFGTIDDLLIAVLRRDGERLRERLAKELESDAPLALNWDLANSAAATMFEFAALAVRRETIRTEVRRYILEFRKMYTQALSRHLTLRGIEADIAPVVTAVVLVHVTQGLALEKALGISEGHAATKAQVKRWFRAFFGEDDALAAASFRSHSRKRSPTRKRKGS